MALLWGMQTKMLSWERLKKWYKIINRCNHEILKCFCTVGWMHIIIMSTYFKILGRDWHFKCVFVFVCVSLVHLWLIGGQDCCWNVVLSHLSTFHLETQIILTLKLATSVNLAGPKSFRIGHQSLALGL